MFRKIQQIRRLLSKMFPTRYIVVSLEERSYGYDDKPITKFRLYIADYKFKDSNESHSKEYSTLWQLIDMYNDEFKDTPNYIVINHYKVK